MQGQGSINIHLQKHQIMNLIIIILRGFGNLSRYSCLHLESCIWEFFSLSPDPLKNEMEVVEETSKCKIWVTITGEDDDDESDKHL